MSGFPLFGEEEFDWSAQNPDLHPSQHQHLGTTNIGMNFNANYKPIKSYWLTSVLELTDGFVAGWR